MCGIAGFVESAARSPADDLCRVVGAMSACLRHRGPDDEGIWADARTGVALGHRRLAILDLSPHGHQPMVSHDGRLVLVFNGEIYNFAELRTSLEGRGVRFRGHSDTEVLLEGIAHWGIEKTLGRSVGMFALAVWDREARTLSLARDRMGEKPLYYGWHRGVFLFASDLAALAAHPDWDGEIDRNAVALLMRYGYIPAPLSIYAGIGKLPPACILTLNEGHLRSGQLPAASPYWSLRTHALAGATGPFTGSDDDAVDALETALRESVRMQMVADVPLGAFLSGGIDSSTVVALMQAESPRPVRTFSIGFHESGYNEATHAAAVARHLGTDHEELYLTPQEAMAVIPSMPGVYTEPFADPSQIPTCLVARLARQRVTVSLSGDGGDELFCGYERYERASQAWTAMRRMPAAARSGLGTMMLSAPDWLLSLAPSTQKAPAAGDSAGWRSVGRMLQQGDSGLYQYLVSLWREPTALVIGSAEPPHPFTAPASWSDFGAFVERAMYVDMLTYLPDDILVKVDRAAMRVGLETRVPLLDHRVVELALRMPLHMKQRNGEGKWLLREVLHRYVPRELVNRPKMGFGVPIGAWLRRPLRDWAEALLDPSRLRNEGYLEPSRVQRVWSEHLEGRAERDYMLWTVLSFQAWLESARTSSRAAAAAHPVIA